MIGWKVEQADGYFRIECTVGQVTRWIERQMDVYVYGSMVRQMEGQMDEGMAGWMGEWTDEWKNGWMERQTGG